MEFKVGGKITLNENEKYYIIEIIEDKNAKYLFCTDAKEKIKPVILEVREFDGKTMVRKEDSPEIIQKITTSILEKDNKEMLKKILK